MTAEEALKLVELVDKWVFAKTGEPLSDVQKAIIQQTLEGKKLKDIELVGYANSSIQRDYAYKLWKLLKKVTGEKKVGVKNLQVVIERLQKRELPKVSDNVTTKVSKTERENSQISEILESFIDNNLCSLSESNFVGRDIAINDINDRINEGMKIIVIQAAGGVGKTTLAKQYLYNNFDLVLPLEMAKDTENITAVESEIETWLKQYFQEEPGRDFKTTLNRLKQQLQNCKIGVLIDNLEPALDKQGRLIEKHSLYVELLRVLSDENVQSLTLITSRERLCDDRVNGTYHYPLAVLTVEAWGEFFTTRKIKVDTPSLEAMHKIYGGNAKAMDILFGVMREDYDGDMSAYWQENSTCVETELKNLVESQFHRLQTLDTEAYKLLCRLGCFRYQDVPRVSVDALLALLWYVPQEKQRDVIKSLRNRCLVEFEKGEYWLHPVIQEEGIERLKASGEWEEVNRKAAEFWTESVKSVETVKDALIAFESYYHYLNIEDYEKAGYVIVKKRNNRIEQNTSLGVNFYRFGLLEKMKVAINIIIDKVKISYTLSRLHNIVGDLYWMVGELSKSIKNHQKCQEIAIQLILEKKKNNHINYIHNLNVVSSFNMGLCYIDLWDFIKAENCFNKSICLYEELKSEQRYFENSIFILAYIYSQINFLEKSLNLLNQCNFEFDSYEISAWGVGYSYIFHALSCKNLKKINDSFESYQQAINFAEEVDYPQVKAKALTGLAELYRIQNDFKTALSYHLESIEILDRIGAKCDLAEAYYQLGLTYQKMGETENSNTNFNEAIQLFQEMEAPKQVEKVEKAKRGNID